MSVHPEFQRALKLRQAGKNLMAANTLEKLIAKRPNDLSALQLAGAVKASLGDFEGAINLLTRARNVAPKNPDPLINLATTLHAAGKLDECLEMLDAAISLDPGHRTARKNRAAILEERGLFEEAEREAHRITQIDAQSPASWITLALLQNKNGRVEDALETLSRVAEKEPKSTKPRILQARILLERGHNTKALEVVNSAIQINANDPEARLCRADILILAEDHHQALNDISFALKYLPNSINGWIQLGICLLKQDKRAEAAEAFATASAKDPQNIQALYNAGTTFLRLGKNELALNYLDATIKNNPEHIEARINRSTTLRNLKRYDEALKDALYVFSRNPDNPDTTLNLGVLYTDLRDFPRACFYFSQTIKTDPQNIRAITSRALIYHEIGQYRLMIADLDEALKLDPDNLNARKLRLSARFYVKDFEGIIADYRDLAERGMHEDYMLGNYLHAKMQMCDWNELGTTWKEIEDRLRNGESALTPFSMISYNESAELALISGQIYAQKAFKEQTDIDKIHPYPAKDRIRVGYFSADFYDHATMHLMAGLFEHHDKTKFETYAFSFGPQIKDQMHQRAMDAFDHFIDASEMTDKTMALVARHFEIDIAIDLKGYTAHSRPNIFAYRAAPVQVNYLGFPGTMGADFIDYIIADPIVIPEELQKFYSEKVLLVPPSYQVNDIRRERHGAMVNRADFGLPEDAFVFCSFNNNYKITPEMFDIWCDLLANVPKSILWMLSDNKSAETNLKNHARDRGIDPSRLIFAPRAAIGIHLSRHRLADLFLDTYPCNAHTTASDSLFMGLPIVTRIGETFASRVAASLLTAAGLPELVATNPEEYKEIALDLARNPDKLSHMRTGLLDGIRDTQLYDTATFTKNFELLLEQIVRRPE